MLRIFLIIAVVAGLAGLFGAYQAGEKIKTITAERNDATAKMTAAQTAESKAKSEAKKAKDEAEKDACVKTTRWGCNLFHGSLSFRG